MGAMYGGIIDRLNDLCGKLPLVERSVPEWQETARAIGLLDGLDDDMAEVISLWPAEMRDALVALVGSSSASGARLRFMWKPGYDFEATITKVNAYRDGQPEYAVMLTSRYPAEIDQR